MKKKLGNIQGCLKNNQGFTLVELLSSFTIFAFFSIALLTYMTTAGSIQSKVNAAVGLETKAQVAMGVIEEYLVDASASVIFKDDILYIMNNKSYDDTSATDSGCTLHGFKWDSTTKKLYYVTARDLVGKTTTTTNIINYQHSGKEEGSDVIVNKFYRSITTVVNQTGSAHSTNTKYYDVVMNYDSTNDVYTEVSKSERTDDKIPPIAELSGWVEKKTYESDSNVVFNSFSWNSTEELLCENVTKFEVTMPNDDLSVVDGRIERVNFVFTLTNGRDDYTKSGYITLRNKPPVGTLT